ncbi:MAG: 50S ribosomal protein L35 [Bacillota bacterium]|nr:50S ribosomal protein L35 [Bacillota bacterium]
MPKIKTHRGAAKRFNVTGTGKVIKNRAFKSHILESKSAKRKRHLRFPEVAADADQKRLRRLVLYK